MGARHGSRFQLALVELLYQELELRSQLYLEHNNDPAGFNDFFDAHKAVLNSGVNSRFAISIPSAERCQILKEKYNAILLANLPPVPKPPIGF